MILSGKEIVVHMGKEIVIGPVDPKRLNPNSYNLFLHKELLVYQSDVPDMKNPNSTQKLEIPPEGWIIAGAGKALSGANPRIHKCRSLCPHVGGPFLHRKVRAIPPYDGRLWGRWILWLLGIGGFLHPAHLDLSRRRDLPNLLSHHQREL